MEQQLKAKGHTNKNKRKRKQNKNQNQNKPPPPKKKVLTRCNYIPWHDPHWRVEEAPDPVWARKEVALILMLLPILARY